MNERGKEGAWSDYVRKVIVKYVFKTLKNIVFCN